MDGLWFDAEQARIVGTEEVSAEERVSPSLLPLGELLTVREFPFTKADFPEADRRQWSAEQCIGAGKLALAAIENDQGQPPVSTKHMARLAIIGQGPDLDVISVHFGNFSNFKRRIGSPIRYDRVRYADWTVTHFVRYAGTVMDQLGRVPGKPDYDHLFDKGEGPSFSLIEDRVGGIRSLHERLGYPDVRTWIRDDFLDWGVRVMAANPDKDFSLYLIQALAGRRRGPSLFAVYGNYGPWKQFRADVEKEHAQLQESRQLERGRKFSCYQDMIAGGSLPQDYSRFTGTELLAAAARYVVAADILKSTDQAQLHAISNTEPDEFITRLRNAKSKLTTAQIEAAALSLGLFDDIWPVNEYYDYLYVPQSEVDTIRRAATQKRLARRWLKRAGRSPSPAVIDRSA